MLLQEKGDDQPIIARRQRTRLLKGHVLADEIVEVLCGLEPGQRIVSNDLGRIVIRQIETIRGMRQTVAGGLGTVLVQGVPRQAPLRQTLPTITMTGGAVVLKDRISKIGGCRGTRRRPIHAHHPQNRRRRQYSNRIVSAFGHSYYGWDKSCTLLPAGLLS